MTNILTSEAILQPSQTSMADHSCKNSQRLKVVNYFSKKASPQMFFWALNAPLYLIWLTHQKTCVSTKKLYKQKTTKILTKYGLPIKSDLISRGKQYKNWFSPKSCLVTNMINNNSNNNNNNNNNNNINSSSSNNKNSNTYVNGFIYNNEKKIMITMMKICSK